MGIQNISTSKSRYLNLFSDRAFRRVFGTERDKAITLSFLNAVLQDKEQIVDFHFASTAYIADNPADRGVVLDLQCQTSDGRRIVVELQKRPQVYFRERSLYYATWPIQSQGKRGRWDYDICAVYVISILDFMVDPNSTDHRIVTRKMLLDVETHEPWTDKLVFISIEMPRFTKVLSECNTLLDKWFYVLRNLHRLMEKPPEFQEEIFAHLFEITDKSIFEESVREKFERSEEEYDQMQNALDFALKSGKAEGKAELVAEMLRNGADWGVITKLTSITPAEFERMKTLAR